MRHAQDLTRSLVLPAIMAGIGLSTSACGDCRSARAIKSIERLTSGGDLEVLEFNYNDGKLSSGQNRDGTNVETEFRVRYDDDKVQSIVVSNINANGEVTSDRTYTFDYSDDLVESINSDFDDKTTPQNPDSGDIIRIDYDDDEVDRLRFFDVSYNETRTEMETTNTTVDYDDGRVSAIIIRSLNCQGQGCETRQEIDFDSDDRIDRITSNSGSSSTRYELEYDEDGKVEEISEQANRWELNYDSDGLIDEIRTPNQTTYTIDYEDFDVEGFTYSPAEGLPSTVSPWLDMAGVSFDTSDIAARFISDIIIDL